MQRPKKKRPENITVTFNFPAFAETVFKQTLNRVYRLLGGNKDAWTALLPVYGFTGKSAFYSALNFANKTERGIRTYETQWQNAIINLPKFCESRDIKLQDLFVN